MHENFKIMKHTITLNITNLYFQHFKAINIFLKISSRLLTIVMIRMEKVIIFAVILQKQKQKQYTFEITSRSNKTARSLHTWSDNVEENNCIAN